MNTLAPRRCLVVGHGSIGSRHARLLAAMGHDVAVVSSRQAPYPAYPDLGQALADREFDYLVVATPTALHLQAMENLAAHGFSGTVLVEKPLFELPRALPEIPGEVRVAYNLRFHPGLRRLAELLQGRRVLSIHSYAGQYLPLWRPGRDYADSYSARKDLGGGALRDLSHELDLVCHLTGPWKEVAARGGQVSDLDMDSDDVFGLLLRTEGCPLATIQINCLDRISQRSLTVNTDSFSARLDMVKHTLTVDGETASFDLTPDTTYTLQHLDALDGGGVGCTLRQGADVVDLISAAERADQEKTWIAR